MTDHTGWVSRVIVLASIFLMYVKNIFYTRLHGRNFGEGQAGKG